MTNSSLLKNPVFRQAAYGTGVYRHFRWLQAIENTMDGFFNSLIVQKTVTDSPTPVELPARDLYHAGIR